MERGEKGFTLVEIIIVVATIALLTWLALPKNYVTDTRIGAAARKIKEDIRYAQELAMTKGKAHQIRFFSSTNPSPTNSYEIVTATLGAVKNPLTGAASYVVNFNSGDFSGVQIGTTTTIEFNGLGRPTFSPANTISLNGGSKVITVTAETGRVEVL
jgi:prepilin-type N-terminal cleavage/methylation domain-containing protein